MFSVEIGSYPSWLIWSGIWSGDWLYSDTTFHQDYGWRSVLPLQHSGCSTVREEQESGDINLFHQSFTWQFQPPLFPKLIISVELARWWFFPVLLVLLHLLFNSPNNFAVHFLDHHTPAAQLQLFILTNNTSLLPASSVSIVSISSILFATTPFYFDFPVSRPIF